MTDKFSTDRRRALRTGLAAVAGVAAVKLGATARPAHAADALDPADPQAAALGYVTDTTTVDAASYPTHTNEQMCSNCALYLEGGGCSIFPGKMVNANGWCAAYAPKG